MKITGKLGFVVMSVMVLIAAVSCSKKSDVSMSVKEDVSWNEVVGLDDQLSGDELYAKAKEEGTVTIYSMSSRFNDVKETFEAQYPGIEVVVYDMRNSEIVEKFQREHEAQIRNADLLFIKDTDGGVFTELVGMGLLKEYIPEDLMKTAPAEFQSWCLCSLF